jgi:hypothetical protein
VIQNKINYGSVLLRKFGHASAHVVHLACRAGYKNRPATPCNK